MDETAWVFNGSQMQEVTLKELDTWIAELETRLLAGGLCWQKRLFELIKSRDSLNRRIKDARRRAKAR